MVALEHPPNWSKTFGLLPTYHGVISGGTPRNTPEHPRNTPRNTPGTTFSISSEPPLTDPERANIRTRLGSSLHLAVSDSRMKVAFPRLDLKDQSALRELWHGGRAGCLSPWYETNNDFHHHHHHGGRLDLMDQSALRELWHGGRAGCLSPWYETNNDDHHHHHGGRLDLMDQSALRELWHGGRAACLSPWYETNNDDDHHHHGGLKPWVFLSCSI